MSRFLAGALAVSILLAGCGAASPTANFATPAQVDSSLVSNSSAAMKTSQDADAAGPYAAIALGEPVPGSEEVEIDLTGPAALDTTPVLPDFTGAYSAVTPGAPVPTADELAEIEEDAAATFAFDDVTGFGVQSLIMYKASIFKIRDKVAAKKGRKGTFAKACEKALETSGKKTSQEMKDLLTAGTRSKEDFLVKAHELSKGGPFTLAYDRKWRLFGIKSEIDTAEEHQAFYDVCINLAAKYAK